MPIVPIHLKMPLFKWDPAIYSVGLDQVDHEHLGIVTVMNSIYQKSKDANVGSMGLEIHKDLIHLSQVGQDHFLAEEEFLRSVKYRDLHVHQGLHRLMISRLNGMIEAYSKNHEPKLLGEILQYMRFWLSAHILSEDKKYAEYVKTLPNTTLSQIKKVP